MILKERGLAAVYLHAKERVLADGYGWEIDWQQNVSLHDLTESTLLREAAWVILSAGISERVVRGVFPRISTAFRDWRSAAEIAQTHSDCRKKALAVFAHRKKIDAIVFLAAIVARQGFAAVRDGIAGAADVYLRAFPQLGPAASRHLAKNLGCSVAKPDRHLRRIAKRLSMRSVDALCTSIASYLGEPVHVIDVVLWRYATLESTYLDALERVYEEGGS